MADFYGLNLLLAETSATSGGLDSLLDPHGAIRDAQNLAARVDPQQQDAAPASAGLSSRCRGLVPKVSESASTV